MGTVCGTDSEHPKYSGNPCKIKVYSPKLASILVNISSLLLTKSLTVGAGFRLFLECQVTMERNARFHFRRFICRSQAVATGGE